MVMFISIAETQSFESVLFQIHMQNMVMMRIPTMKSLLQESVGSNEYHAFRQGVCNISMQMNNSWKENGYKTLKKVLHLQARCLQYLYANE